MNQPLTYTTRDAAQHLQVHARTIRKWIDVFEEYICPDLNERGHYLFNEESMSRLEEIRDRLHETNKSMKQLREELYEEGKIQTPVTATQEAEKVWHPIMNSVEQIGQMVENLFDRMDRLEDHLFGLYDTLEDLEQKLVALSFDSVSANEVHQMFDEIRKKQDQFKIELRNIHFSQRLSSAANETNIVPKRPKKSRFLFFF